MDELNQLKKKYEEIKNNQEKELEIKELKKKIWEYEHRNDFSIKFYNSLMKLMGILLRLVGNMLKSIWEWFDKLSDPPGKRK